MRDDSEPRYSEDTRRFRSERSSPADADREEEEAAKAAAWEADRGPAFRRGERWAKLLDQKVEEQKNLASSEEEAQYLEELSFEEEALKASVGSAYQAEQAAYQAEWGAKDRPLAARLLRVARHLSHAGRRERARCALEEVEAELLRPD